MKNNKSSFFCLPFPWVLSCFYLEKLVIIFNTSPKGDWGVLHLWLQNIFFDRIGLSIHSFVMWCLAETVAILFSINKHCLMIITLLYIPFYVCFSRSWTKKKPEESAMGKWYRTQAKVMGFLQNSNKTFRYLILPTKMFLFDGMKTLLAYSTLSE